MPLRDLELQPPAPDERLPDWWAAAHPEHPDVVRQRELDANQTTTAEDGTSQDVQFRIVPKSSSNKNAPTDGRGDLNSKG